MNRGIKMKKPDLSKFTFSISSAWAIGFMAIYFATVLNMGFWRFIFDRLAIEGVNEVLFITSMFFGLAFPVYLFMNIFFVPKAGKWVAGALIIGSSFANYFMFSLGVFIDVDMVRNTLATNPGEAVALVNLKMMTYAFVTGVIPCVLL